MPEIDPAGIIIGALLGWIAVQVGVLVYYRLKYMRRRRRAKPWVPPPCGTCDGPRRLDVRHKLPPPGVRYRPSSEKVAYDEEGNVKYGWFAEHWLVCDTCDEETPT